MPFLSGQDNVKALPKPVKEAIEADLPFVRRRIHDYFKSKGVFSKEKGFVTLRWLAARYGVSRSYIHVRYSVYLRHLEQSEAP